MDRKFGHTRQKILVGMSGGVDSTVAAFLLLQDGYEVEGVYLNLWLAESQANRLRTTAGIDRAQQAAKQLGIVLRVVEAGEPFRQIVVANFLHELGEARTPNPCVVCNPLIKWQLLSAAMRGAGADRIATGHYARIMTAESGDHELHQGVDGGKDQSYFLARLTQQDLARSLFPLGGSMKADVREVARQQGFASSDLPESQDLCFLGDVPLEDFLHEQLPQGSQPGEVVDREDVVLGRHRGLAHYTIGQRKGIGIAAAEPYYVISKQAGTNRLVVGRRDSLGGDTLRATNCTWINAEPQLGESFDFKIRYKSLYNKGSIVAQDGDAISVQFDSPLRDITPGQLLVCYQGSRVVGSGFIDG